MLFDVNLCKILDLVTRILFFLKIFLQSCCIFAHLLTSIVSLNYK